MTHIDCRGCGRDDRRSFLKKVAGVSAGLFGLGLTNRFFMEQAYGITPSSTRLYDACIQIFYSGGPSQTDTWDPKPNSAISNVFNTINLGARDIYGNDVHISEVFPNLANLVQNDPAVGLGIVRSMAHGNGSHSAGQTWMNCFWQSPVADIYPSTAAAMAYLQDGNSPTGIASVLISGSNGAAANDAKGSLCPTAFLSTGNATDMLSRPSSVDSARYSRRRDLAKLFGRDFATLRPDVEVSAWNDAVDKAYDVTTSGKAAAAFDTSGVPRLPGGPNANSSNLARLTLAQELVKAGVPFVSCGIGGNDTHSNNMATIRRNWGDTTDVAVAQMLTNLKATGKRVLVVMGGEFGRDPDDVASGRDGRDHWADGFSWAMLSLNQPAFKTTAVGDTGPDGLFRERDGNLVDPVSPSALGGLIYGALGFPIGDSRYTIPTSVGDKPPVDQALATSTQPGGGAWLMQQFGLA